MWGGRWVAGNARPNAIAGEMLKTLLPSPSYRRGCQSPDAVADLCKGTELCPNSSRSLRTGPAGGKTAPLCVRGSGPASESSSREGHRGVPTACLQNTGNPLFSPGTTGPDSAQTPQARDRKAKDSVRVPGEGVPQDPGVRASPLSRTKALVCGARPPRGAAAPRRRSEAGSTRSQTRCREQHPGPAWGARPAAAQSWLRSTASASRPAGEPTELRLPSCGQLPSPKGCQEYVSQSPTVT